MTDDLIPASTYDEAKRDCFERNRSVFFYKSCMCFEIVFSSIQWIDKSEAELLLMKMPSKSADER